MRKLFQACSILALCAALDTSLWAQGCSMCRTALESSAEGRVIASSFANGILMMLILPYLLFGTFGFFIYRAYRKKSKGQAAGSLPVKRSERPDFHFPLLDGKQTDLR